MSRSLLRRAALLGAFTAAFAAHAPAALALTADEQLTADLIALPTSVTDWEGTPRQMECARINVVVSRGSTEPANLSPGLDGATYRDHDPATSPEVGESVLNRSRLGPDNGRGVWWQIAKELFAPTDGSEPLPLTATAVLRTDLSYLATNDIPTGVPQGTYSLIKYLNAVNDRCPATRFVLLGYSQGALVIDNSLSVPSRRHFWNTGIDQLTTATTNAIAAVGLIGNASFSRSFSRRALSDYALPVISEGFAMGTYPDTTKGFNDGNFEAAYQGVTPRSPYAFAVKTRPTGTAGKNYAVNPNLTEDVAAKVRDFCKARDYICQWGNWRSTVAMHASYAADDAPRRNLAVFALERIKPLL